MNLTATLIGQMLTFAALIWFVQRFLWGPLTQIMEDRKTRIADGLAAADRGRQQKELAEDRAKGVLQEARTQAGQIINHAEKRAGEIVEEAKEAAHAEGQRLVHAAEAEIQLETNRAREQLRAQVAALAVAGAEKILQREVDVAAHQDALDKVVEQI